MDRVRGVAPAVSETTTSPTTALTKPGQVETIRVGDVDLALKPETGDIHWAHTLIGLAPKAFGFLEKFSEQVNKTVRTHEVSQAVQSGRMPTQFVPQQSFVPQPAFVPQQPQFMAQPPPATMPPPAPQPQVVEQTAPPPAQTQQTAVRSLFS
jgi:hypothetical protein